MEGARGCAAQRSRRGKGPFMPRKALATCRAALRFARKAADERRGKTVAATKGTGRARTRAARRTAPAWARWPPTNFRWKSSLHGAQRLHRVQTIRAVHHGPALTSLRMRTTGQRCVPAGHQRDRQSNDLSPGYWMFDGRGGNFDLTADRSICAGNTGIEFVMDYASWARYRSTDEFELRAALARWEVLYGPWHSD